MFSTKNYTPQQIAFLTALALSVPISLAILFITKDWKWSLGALVVILGGSYWLIHFMMERFIYRKIKLIYKFIYETKATKKEETYYKYILPKKSIDDVREDVEKWATRKKQQIELLQQNESFRRDFLQNLSHEFKTPVFAIQGYVDTLLAGALDNPSVNKKFLENASKNVDRLTNLLSDLDEISGLERGELVLNTENFVIQDLVKEVFESLSILADSKKIKFSIKKGCESPLVVNADKEKIRQVIYNLVENSIKYGRQGGNTVVSMYKIEGPMVLVEVTDDGMGVPEQYLDRIFERFFRTDQGRSVDVTGSGLGLAICKHIIEAHGNTIHARSRLSLGTTIGFTLDKKKE